MVKEGTHGLMEGSILDNGRTMTLMVMVFSPGQTDEDMKATLERIKGMAKAFSNGPMVEYMMANGQTESSMGAGNTRLIGKISEMGFGLKASGYNG